MHQKGLFKGCEIPARNKTLATLNNKRNKENNFLTISNINSNFR